MKPTTLKNIETKAGHLLALTLMAGSAVLTLLVFVQIFLPTGG